MDRSGFRVGSDVTLTLETLDAALKTFDESHQDGDDDWYTMFISTRNWVELRLTTMDFGWWPLSIIRRSAVRKYMIAEANRRASEEDDDRANN